MAFPPATAAIVAQAFRLMELNPVSSLADDSTEAQEAAEQYDIARRMVLEAADWSFASRYAVVPEIVGGAAAPATDPDLPHAYALPPDCLAVRQVLPTAGAGLGEIRWRRDAEGLRCDQELQIALRYTADIRDETTLPATVQTGLAMQLAVLLAPRWVTTRTKIADLQTGLQRSLQQALRADADQASLRPYVEGASLTPWAQEAIL